MSGLAVLNAGLAGLGNAGVILKSKRDYDQETARFETEQKQREANVKSTQQQNQEFDYTKLDPARIQHERRIDEEAATRAYIRDSSTGYPGFQSQAAAAPAPAPAEQPEQVAGPAPEAAPAEQPMPASALPGSTLSASPAP